MINAITYDNFIITVRKLIISQTGIKEDKVLNASSVRGVGLSKLIGNSSTSVNLDDDFIIFKVMNNTNSDNYITTEEDGSISVIMKYNFILHVYGNNANALSQKLLARIKSESVIMSLHDSGIYLTGFDVPNDVDEFINNTLIRRYDTTLYFEVRHSYDDKSNPGYVNDDYIYEAESVKIVH